MFVIKSKEDGPTGGHYWAFFPNCGPKGMSAFASLKSIANDNGRILTFPDHSAAINFIDTLSWLSMEHVEICPNPL